MQVDDRCVSIDAVVVHIAARRAVGCVRLQKVVSADPLVCPLFAADCHDTVAVDLCCKGIAMSGSGVRSLTDSSTGEPSGQEDMHRSKKKKNRKVKDGSKDRFTRGMTLKG